MCLTTLFAGAKAPHPLFLWHGVRVPTDDPVPHSAPVQVSLSPFGPTQFFSQELYNYNQGDPGQEPGAP